VVLTKDELIGSLKDEVRILLHLASKVDPQRLDYRPTAKQRSTLELLQYLTIVGPIHLRTVASGVFDMDVRRDTWRAEEKAAAARDLEETKQEIGRLAGMFSEVIGALSDDDLRAPIVDRQAGTESLHRISDAAVSLSQGEWARRVEYDESLGGDGCAVLRSGLAVGAQCDHSVEAAEGERV
jgi:hypothetical protein